MNTNRNDQPDPRRTRRETEELRDKKQARILLMGSGLAILVVTMVALYFMPETKTREMSDMVKFMLGLIFGGVGGYGIGAAGRV